MWLASRALSRLANPQENATGIAKALQLHIEFRPPGEFDHPVAPANDRENFTSTTI